MPTSLTTGRSQENSPCQSCNGSGWTPVTLPGGYKGVERCSCRTTEHRLLSLGFGKEHNRWTLGSFGKKLETSGQKIVEQRQFGGVLLAGPAGSGKTSFMAALCHALIDREADIPIRLCIARALLRRIWSTYRDESEEKEEDVVRDFSEVTVLAIDDLGKEGKVSDASLGAFHEILSKRGGNGLLTIITTNLRLEPDPDEKNIPNITELYDASLASRLGSWTRIVMAGEDRRKRRGKERELMYITPVSI